jgi:hypothetical protein
MFPASINPEKPTFQLPGHLKLLAARYRRWNMDRTYAMAKEELPEMILLVIR